MSFASPNAFMNLSTSLTSLDLSESVLTGEFPENIFHLPRLQKLDLSYNWNLSGSFPQYNWSSQLRNLNLSETGFLIDLPYLTKTLKYLNTLFSKLLQVERIVSCTSWQLNTNHILRPLF